MQPSKQPEFENVPALITWLTCMFGLCGVHRFYLGQPGMGLLYLFTGGLFGVGQFVDLIRMRTLVEEANMRQQLKHGRSGYQIGTGFQRQLPAPKAMTENDFRLALTKTAQSNGGSISVTQGVLATGKNFAEVEAMLDKMAQSGYVDIGNDPESGVVVYIFSELQN